MLIKENFRLKKIFAEYIKKTNATSSSSYGGYYGGNGYYYGGQGSLIKHIYFYEWSNMSNGAKMFNSIETFKKFCDENKITIPNGFNTDVEKGHWAWCTCIPGKSTLMWADSWNNLKILLDKEREKYEKAVKEGTTSNLPCVANQYY